MTLQSSGSMTAAQIASELRTSMPITIAASSTNIVNWLAERNGSSVTIPTHLYGKSAIKLVDTAVNTGNGTSYTFNGVNFGPDISGRRIFVCTFLWATGAVALDVSSVTIGGETGVGSDSGEFESGGPTAGAGVWRANPSGTSGSVVVQFPGTANGGAIAVLSAAGTLNSSTDSLGRTGTGSGASSFSGNITTGSDGVIIAAVCRGNTSSVTWTGLNDAYEMVDQTVDSNFRIACIAQNRFSSGSNSVGFSSSGTVATGFQARSYD